MVTNQRTQSPPPQWLLKDGLQPSKSVFTRPSLLQPSGQWLPILRMWSSCPTHLYEEEITVKQKGKEMKRESGLKMSETGIRLWLKPTLELLACEPTDLFFLKLFDLDDLVCSLTYPKKTLNTHPTRKATIGHFESIWLGRPLLSSAHPLKSRFFLAAFMF